MKQQSSTYLSILDLLFKLSNKTVSGNSYSTTLDNGTFKRTNLGSASNKIPQEIFISDLEFGKNCSPHEWYFLTWVIGLNLKLYNALWYCDPKLKNNGANNKAIKTLINKGVLTKTETTNIYFVNPFIIRRGELFAVLTTTAKILQDEARVGIEHIKDSMAVKEFKYKNDTKEVGYGYTSDEVHDN